MQTIQLIDEHILDESAVMGVIRTALNDSVENPTRPVGTRMDSRKIYQITLDDGTPEEAEAVEAAVRAAFPYATTPAPGE